MPLRNQPIGVELEVLYRIFQAMVRQHDVTALVTEVLDIMETEMGMARSTLTLRRHGTNVFVIEASRGLTAEEQKRGQYTLGEGITGRVAKTGKPAVVPDISKEPGFLNLTGSRRNTAVAFLCVPIVHSRSVIGTLSVDRPGTTEQALQNDLYFLQLVANVLAEAVAGIREQMEERSSLMA
jgi:Nif-specific regulatory protein